MTETAEVDGPVQNSSPRLSKVDRKKLKKLRKRAAHVLVESERSGLLTRSESEEYQALLQLEQQHNSNAEESQENSVDKTVSPSSPAISSLPMARPSVNLRKKCIGIEKVEGSTNRDLLSWLLQQKFDRPQQQSKKRQRDDDDSGENDNVTIAVPHWASIHNPGTCEQVAVLEVHFPYDNIDSYCQFLKSYRSESKTRNGVSINQSFPRSQVGVTTKWFQGHMPKSMSEALLYFSNSRKETKKKTTEGESSFASRSDIIKRLETMLLPREQMAEQGYPSVLSSSMESVTFDSLNEEIKSFISRKETLQSPDAISLEKAKTYVSACGVRVEQQNEEDKNTYISTPDATSMMDNSNHTHNDKIPIGAGPPVRVLGLDCEMVLTTVGSELARVTIVEFDEFVDPKTRSKTNVLLDCFVRPDNRIVDYLTKHSGITPAILEPVSTRLEQVQCALASYLTPQDILIGHSLENDLRALHYIHPRIVDTSMIFRPSGQNQRFKFSLRHLAGTILKKQIQNGSHCSEEDAQTALDLALLKALKGDGLRVPGFGDNQRKSLLRQQFVKKSVAAFIGPNEWLETHITKHPSSAHALNYDSPDDCKKAMLAWLKNSRKAHLVWSKIDLGNKSSINCRPGSSLEVFKSLVIDIVEKLPPTCVLMVAIQGELQNAKDMFKRRGACRDPRSSIIWSNDNEETWNELLNSTRIGYVQWYSAPINNKM